MLKRKRLPFPEEIIVIDETNVEINIRKMKSFILCKDRMHKYNPEIEIFPLQINYKNNEIQTINFESLKERFDICNEFMKYNILFYYE